MSRRYGRNQRRAAREALAQAELRTAYWIDREADRGQEAAKARQRFYDLQEEVGRWADRIVSLLGDDSAFARTAPVREVVQSMFDAYSSGRPMEVLRREPLSLARWSDDPMSYRVAQEVIQLFTTYVDVSDERISMRRRVVVRSPAGDLAYMVDQPTMDTMRRDARAGREWVMHILGQMLRKWNAADKAKRRA